MTKTLIIKENAFVQVHSIDNAMTSAEIEDAKRLLLCNLRAFLSLTSIGEHLRKSEIERFVQCNKSLLPKDADYTLIAIIADLMNDIDVSNALKVQQECNITQ